LSLDPLHSDIQTTRPRVPATGPATPQFHFYYILGQTRITEPQTQKKLTEALQAGARGRASPAACFDPRHGIRVTRSGTVIDIVICFECSQAKVYVNNVADEDFLTTSSPEAVFDEVLKSAGVPLAPKSK
jgi:hypothetical protein